MERAHASDTPGKHPSKSPQPKGLLVVPAAGHLACIAGSCCPTCGSPDFNSDGDSATDADIEAFFRVLADGNC